MNKVLISDRVHPHMISGLQEQGYEIDYQPDISLTEVHTVIHNYVGIVINSKVKMNKELIDKAICLTWVARLGSGLEIIDIPYATKQNIEVINSPEGNRNAVAEHALGMLLALCNNIITSDRQVRNMKWDRESNRGIELEGKKIGII